MDAIATYSERRVDGRREFSVYSHEILIVGRRRFGMHYEIRLPLKNIEPTVSRLYARSALFLPGMCFAVGTGFVCLILAGLSVPFTFWMTWIIIAFGIVGFLLACLTFKRVEFAQFRNHGGLTILDVARSGPERHKFDEFIRTLIQQIQAAKETASNSGAPAER